MKPFAQLRGEMTWKNYVAAGGTIITIATVLVTGGRILEQIEATRSDLAAMKLAQAESNRAIALLQVRLEQQVGRDAVHEEQIMSLRRDVNGVMRARGH